MHIDRSRHVALLLGYSHILRLTGPLLLSFPSFTRVRVLSASGSHHKHGPISVKQGVSAASRHCGLGGSGLAFCSSTGIDDLMMDSLAPVQ